MSSRNDRGGDPRGDPEQRSLERLLFRITVALALLTIVILLFRWAWIAIDDEPVDRRGHREFQGTASYPRTYPRPFALTSGHTMWFEAVASS